MQRGNRSNKVEESYVLQDSQEKHSQSPIQWKRWAAILTLNCIVCNIKNTQFHHLQHLLCKSKPLFRRNIIIFPVLDLFYGRNCILSLSNKAHQTHRRTILNFQYSVIISNIFFQSVLSRGSFLHVVGSVTL